MLCALSMHARLCLAMLALCPLCSDNLDTVFAQRKNLLSPSFLGMLRDVIRFGKEAPKARAQCTP